MLVRAGDQKPVQIIGRQPLAQAPDALLADAGIALIVKCLEHDAASFLSFEGADRTGGAG
jgi:hypothetical protein